MEDNKSKVRVVTHRPESEAIQRQDLAPQPGASPIFAHAMTQHTCEGEARRPGDCEIFMLQSVYQGIVEHLKSDTAREHGGLLLGYELYAPGSATVVITHSLTAQHTKGTPTSLSFEPETWAEFDRQTDQMNEMGLKLQRVGWYHSHPNIAIFLSGWDIDVCTNFTRPNHLALVVDPVRDNGGFFVRGIGKEGFRQHVPQGFIELHDEHDKSVVTWKNMSAHEVNAPVFTAPSAVSGTSAVTIAAPSRPAPAPIHINRPPSGYVLPRWMAHSAAAVGICLMVGLLVAAIMASSARKEVNALQAQLAELRIPSLPSPTPELPGTIPDTTPTISGGSESVGSESGGSNNHNQPPATVPTNNSNRPAATATTATTATRSDNRNNNAGNSNRRQTATGGGKNLNANGGQGSTASGAAGSSSTPTTVDTSPQGQAGNGAGAATTPPEKGTANRNSGAPNNSRQQGANDNSGGSKSGESGVKNGTKPSPAPKATAAPQPSSTPPTQPG